MWTVTGELFHVELLENMKRYNRSMITKLRAIEHSGKVQCRPTNRWHRTMCSRTIRGVLAVTRRCIAYGSVLNYFNCIIIMHKVPFLH